MNEQDRKLLWIVIAVLAFLLLVGFECMSYAYDKPIIIDDLDGSTVGTKKGKGKFLPTGGWYSTGGYIVYDVGQILHEGYMETYISGWTSPAQGPESSIFISGWQKDRHFSQHTQQGSYWYYMIGSSHHPFVVKCAWNALPTSQEWHTDWGG